MLVKAQQLTTNARPESKSGKFVQFPLVRILVVVLFFVPFLAFHNTVIGDFLASLKEPYYSYVGYADKGLSILIFFLLYRLYTGYVEKREAFELGTRCCLLELGAGFLISLGLVGSMVLLLTALGYYRVDQMSSGKIIWDGLFFFGMGAFVQVLAFRVILFRLLEELLGSWAVLALVAAIFGFAHIGNQNATVWSTVAIIISDILLIAAFMFTRRIWLTWGIHWGWNFFQDGIFGMPNSGITELPSWIQPVIHGPEWVTGGSFGIEASVITVALSVVVGYVILKKATTNNQFLAPKWRRRVTPATT